MTRQISRHRVDRRQNNQAIILSDYEDLHDHITAHHGSPLLVITELLDSARKYLKNTYDLEAIHIAAYADFRTLDEDGMRVQHRLHEYGFDSRFVYSTTEDSSVEMQICVDAASALHTYGVGTFVLVTATRRYLPLVHHLRRNGRRVIVLALNPHPDDRFFDDGISYVNALDLFGPTMRSRLAPIGQNEHAYHFSEDGEAAYEPPSDRPSHSRITSAGLLRALEIIEEYFGQYEEVYLTPLLRKLSELMDEDRHDPKDVVSGLEEAGAVWLEKRPAHPHDYTVLLVDDEHPDVIAIREEFDSTRETENGYDRPYYYDESTDEYDDIAIGRSSGNDYDQNDYEDVSTPEQTSDEIADDSANDDYNEQRLAG